MPAYRAPKNVAEALASLGIEKAVPSPTAVRLAAALAECLDAVIPRPFRVQAEGGYISGYEGDRWDSSSDVAGVLDWNPSPARETGWHPADPPFVERVVSIADGVLNSVQDMIAEATTEPWPRLSGGGMAIPGSRADSERVFMWYGPDSQSEDGAVILLPPIELSVLERG